jgi:hypothetical protein
LMFRHPFNGFRDQFVLPVALHETILDRLA